MWKYSWYKRSHYKLIQQLNWPTKKLGKGYEQGIHKVKQLIDKPVVNHSASLVNVGTWAF